MSQEKEISINDGIAQLNKKEDKVESINEALSKNSSGSELASFMIRFANSKDCEGLIKVLSKIQDQPQIFKRKNNFETVYSTAMIDGERQLFKKFIDLVIAASNGDMPKLEDLLNK